MDSNWQNTNLIEVLEINKFLCIKIDKTSSKNDVEFEIIGDQKFFYKGRLTTYENNLSIIIDKPDDEILFIKIFDINKDTQNINTAIKFYKNSEKKIQKNISMKIIKKNIMNNSVLLEDNRDDIFNANNDILIELNKINLNDSDKESSSSESGNKSSTESDDENSLLTNPWFEKDSNIKSNLIQEINVKENSDNDGLDYESNNKITLEETLVSGGSKKESNSEQESDNDNSEKESDVDSEKGSDNDDSGNGFLPNWMTMNK